MSFDKRATNREAYRGNPRFREQQLRNGNAQQRALRKLRDNHREEYDCLYQAEKRRIARQRGPLPS